MKLSELLPKPPPAPEFLQQLQRGKEGQSQIAPSPTPEKILELEAGYPKINLPRLDAAALRVAVRGMPTMALRDAYCKLQDVEKDGVVPFEGPMKDFRDAAKEVLFERGRLPNQCG